MGKMCLAGVLLLGDYITKQRAQNKSNGELYSFRIRYSLDWQSSQYPFWTHFQTISLHKKAHAELVKAHAYLVFLFPFTVSIRRALLVCKALLTSVTFKLLWRLTWLISWVEGGGGGEEKLHLASPPLSFLYVPPKTARPFAFVRACLGPV